MNYKKEYRLPSDMGEEDGVILSYQITPELGLRHTGRKEPFISRADERITHAAELIAENVRTYYSGS